MQPLTAAPRQALSEAAVRALLTAVDIEVSAGLELLENNSVVDISDDLVGGEVSHDNYATVHGSCRLQVTRELAWGKDRVRPYMVLSDGITTARFNLGVYVLTTPDSRHGEDPVTYDVTGYDLLHLLQNGPGDTYVVEPEAGANVVTNSSFETDATGWESNPSFGAYTPATISRVTTRASVGAASLQAVLPTAPTSWANTHVDGLQLGKVYRFTADVYVPAGGPNVGLDVAFRSTMTARSTAKDQWVPLEMFWTATATDAFIGVWAENPTGQTIWVDNVRFEALSTTYLQAVQGALELAGVGAPLLLAGDRLGSVVEKPMVWALTTDGPTWLGIVNDLLSAINYRPLWADQNGTLRSDPYLAPEVRGEEWTFDTTDTDANIVGEDFTEVADVWKAPNWWRFVRTRMDYQPVEGDGIYTVQNTTDGPTSQTQLGRVVRKTLFLDAADQAALVEQGDRIVAEDRRVTRTFPDLPMEALPIAQHEDVVRLIGRVSSDNPDVKWSHRCYVASWTLPLDGSQGRWALEVIGG